MENVAKDSANQQLVASLLGMANQGMAQPGASSFPHLLSGLGTLAGTAFFGPLGGLAGGLLGSFFGSRMNSPAQRRKRLLDNQNMRLAMFMNARNKLSPMFEKDRAKRIGRLRSSHKYWVSNPSSAGSKALRDTMAAMIAKSGEKAMGR